MVVDRLDECTQRFAGLMRRRVYKQLALRRALCDRGLSAAILQQRLASPLSRNSLD